MTVIVCQLAEEIVVTVGGKLRWSPVTGFIQTKAYSTADKCLYALFVSSRCRGWECIHKLNLRQHNLLVSESLHIVSYRSILVEYPREDVACVGRVD